MSGVQLVTMAHRKLDGTISLAILRGDNSETVWSGAVDLSKSEDLDRAAKSVREKILGLTVGGIKKQLQAIEPQSLDLIDETGRIWTEPKALPDPLPEVLPYDSDLLPAIVGDAVADVSHRMQCPPDYVACALLVAMGAVVGNRIGIRPKQNDTWLVVANLWGCIIGRPSMKKSPSASFAEGLIRSIEDRDRKRVEPMIADWKRDELLSEAKKAALKTSLKESIKKNQDDDHEHKKLAMDLVSLESVQVPTSRRIISTDSTIEKLVELLNIHQLGMILWRDELISWMRGLDREDQAGVRQQFLTLWNGYGRINVDRIGRGETVCESPCLSIFGCATPGGIQEYVQASLKGGRGDDGLLQRFQVTVWPDEPDEIQGVDQKPDRLALQRVQDVFDRLAGFESRDIADKDCASSEIPWMRFSPDGQSVFNEWLLDKDRRCRAESMPEAIESHLAKFNKLVPSIALLIELCDGPAGSVTKRSVERAVKWAGYLESHALRLYAVAAYPERVLASPLLNRLLDWDEERPIRVRDIRQKGWRGLSDPKVIESTLEALESDGWLQSIEDGKTPRGGRSTMTYFLHPEAKKWIGILGDGTTKTTKTPAGDGSG